MRLRKDHRRIAKAVRPMGFSFGLTQKGHMRLVHEPTKKVIYGPGTPSDRRSYTNLMAQVRRFVRDNP